MGNYRHCRICGYKLKNTANDDNEAYISPKGFIEVFFAKNGYGEGSIYRHDAGYINVYFDNDMAWMIPVKSVNSPLQVLYSGLSDFLSAHTDQDTSRKRRSKPAWCSG